jgi:hypothetical protein
MGGREIRLAEIMQGVMEKRGRRWGRVNRQSSWREVPLAMVDLHRVRLDEAALRVLARMDGRALAVRRGLRVAVMVRRTAVMRTVIHRRLDRHGCVLTEMVHAAAQ